MFALRPCFTAGYPKRTLGSQCKIRCQPGTRHDVSLPHSAINIAFTALFVGMNTVSAVHLSPWKAGINTAFPSLTAIFCIPKVLVMDVAHNESNDKCVLYERRYPFGTEEVMHL